MYIPSDVKRFKHLQRSPPRKRLRDQLDDTSPVYLRYYALRKRARSIRRRSTNCMCDNLSNLHKVVKWPVDGRTNVQNVPWLKETTRKISLKRRAFCQSSLTDKIYEAEEFGL